MCNPESLVATSESWNQLHPLPEQHTRIALNIKLNAKQAARIRQGFIPCNMDEKWFSYFENNTLYQHRSWTGFCIDQIHFVEDGDGLRATHAEVSRDDDQYGNQDDAEDLERINEMVTSLANLSMGAKSKAANSMEASFTKAMEPKYLGNPELVKKILKSFFDAVLQTKLALNIDDLKTASEQLDQENLKLSKIFSGEDSSYTVIGTWNSERELGQVLIKCFNLNADYLSDENMLCILSEGFAGLSLEIGRVFKQYTKGNLLTFDHKKQLLSSLDDMLMFTVSVLVGTSSVTHPGITLQDFPLTKKVESSNDTKTASSHFHPKLNNGVPVKLENPSQPSPLANWGLSDMLATATPYSKMPNEVNGIAIQPWIAPNDVADWDKLVSATQFDEPLFKCSNGKTAASGAVVIESDGRVWVVSPSNQFAGYINTFPKGKIEAKRPLSLRANAMKEVYEESGLKIELTGFLCDSERTTTTTRFYLARRVGGSPAECGWESQAVHLVPRAQLSSFASHKSDLTVLQAVDEKVPL